MENRASNLQAIQSLRATAEFIRVARSASDIELQRASQLKAEVETLRARHDQLLQYRNEQIAQIQAANASKSGEFLKTRKREDIDTFNELMAEKQRVLEEKQRDEDQANAIEREIEKLREASKEKLHINEMINEETEKGRDLRRKIIEIQSRKPPATDLAQEIEALEAAKAAYTELLQKRIIDNQAFEQEIRVVLKHAIDLTDAYINQN